jgi:photosystem II PsbU protein
MKRLVSWLMSGVLLASLLFGLVMAPTAQAADLSNVADEKIAERGDKVDLNNCSVRRFQAFPGMYPTLAGKIVLGGPYNSVDDLFNLDLTDRQKELVEKYKSNFTVTPPLDRSERRFRPHQRRPVPLNASTGVITEF